jgi:osmotically-inducible protein OsmY
LTNSASEVRTTAKKISTGKFIASLCSNQEQLPVSVGSCNRRYFIHLLGNTMKIAQRIATLLFAASLIAVAGCASTSTQEGTGEYIDDSVITTKVKAQILNEPTLKSLEINVETFKGAVQLSGFVSSTANVDKAIAIARSVKGVVSVKNDMRLK